MSSARRCGKCGAELPADATAAVCARCQLLHEQGSAKDDSQAIGAANAATLPPRINEAVGTPQESPRRLFGDYEILEEIAHGGMGVVYKARQLSLNRLIALKMILAGEWATPAARQRFRAEAEAAANLQHPNIVAIHEVGEHEGQQYFSMDFVAGSNLADFARRNPLSPERAASFVQTIAEAVHFAHERGILHRDLKPQNILIDADHRPRITDFGLAKRVETDSGLTRTGDVIGSPSYMPPEQAASLADEVGPHSDVYSLGAILYELLTGRPPFQAATAWETICQVLQTPPVPPRKLNPAVPRDLETICLKCLEKSPTRRFGSAQELAAELARFLHGERIVSSSQRLEPARIGKWSGWGLVIGGIAGVVLGAIGSHAGTLLSTLTANLAWRALGGCLAGGLVAAAFVVFFNTIVLPASVLRQTTVPLAKVALGLGLLFHGLVLVAALLLFSIFVPNLVNDDRVPTWAVVRLSLLVETTATLFLGVGPVLCLEIGPKSRSSGVLLWAVVLQVAALVASANPSINEVRISNFQFTWAGLLTLVSVPLFLIFLQKLAGTLERPDLAQRTRSVLKLLGFCLAAIVVILAAAVFQPRFSARFNVIRPLFLVWVLSYLVTLLASAIVLSLLFLRCFKLIRDLQAEIMQRI